MTYRISWWIYFGIISSRKLQVIVLWFTHINYIRLWYMIGIYSWGYVGKTNTHFRCCPLVLSSVACWKIRERNSVNHRTKLGGMFIARRFPAIFPWNFPDCPIHWMVNIILVIPFVIVTSFIVHSYVLSDSIITFPIKFTQMLNLIMGMLQWNDSEIPMKFHGITFPQWF